MRVAIVGSRGFTNRRKVEAYVERLIAEDGWLTIVTGGADGVDTWAEHIADANGVPVALHLPAWDVHGKRAGFLRNQEIVDDAQRVVAFWDGTSRGTKNTIDLALRARKPLEVHFPKGPE